MQAMRLIHPVVPYWRTSGISKNARLKEEKPNERETENLQGLRDTPLVPSGTVADTNV